MINLREFHELIDTGDVSKIDAYFVLKGDARRVDYWVAGNADDLTLLLVDCMEDESIYRIIWRAALLAKKARAKVMEGGEE